MTTTCHHLTKVVDTDEGPRKGVTAESLGKIRPAFKKDVRHLCR